MVDSIGWENVMVWEGKSTNSSNTEVLDDTVVRLTVEKRCDRQVVLIGFGSS